MLHVPPHIMKEAILDPVHTAITFVFSACARFSKTWIEDSGGGPRDIAMQMSFLSVLLKVYTLFRHQIGKSGCGYVIILSRHSII